MATIMTATLLLMLKFCLLFSTQLYADMNELNSSNVSGPKKMTVWTEGTKIETKEFVLPASASGESSDDIPTLPDFDEIQDFFDKEVSKPPVTDHHKDTETANTLAEVGGGFSASVEGIEATMDVLRSCVPEVELDTADDVWTVDSLLTQLADEEPTS